MSGVDGVGHGSPLMNRLLNRHAANHTEKPGTSNGDIVTISEEGKKKHILGQVKASISESGKGERRGR
ncbi:MAG: hypothetical protein HZB84_08995 [Deltaproteobacteria bacterium]|nr:hypothetical protein [Deltaproteobacteria bacterium]